MKTVDDGKPSDNEELNDTFLAELLNGMPTVLFACHIHENVFKLDNAKRQFEKQFDTFGPAQFVYLPSFRRVRISYESSQEATQAKISLHMTKFLNQAMELYFAQTTSAENGAPPTTLLPPVAEKQFLISPPASPPVGWEPIHENKPTTNFDLLSSLVELAPGESHELHKATASTPSVVVHVCEDSNQAGKATLVKIPQTRRPGC
ncbi:unnamed protein product [Clavelina lepadiformis]|uniref:Calcipressin-2 n=1 Tax=Clavelina lepadiformis TaxID=159417 RepID=A0ABP0GI38_CLALP